jgi:hypothetical protein
MQSNDPFGDLPLDARSALLGLIGSTFAELKKVDANIISRNENVTAMKSDLNKLVQEANMLAVPHPQPQPQQHQPQLHPQPVPVLQPIPIIASDSAPALQAPQSVDPNQMEFDFYKKITPEDLNNKLADINLQLSNIVDKLDKLYTIVADGSKYRQ